MERLFSEFPPVTTAEWMEVVQKDLKGQDFDRRLVAKTLDGLTVKPFYRSEDLPDSARCTPGQGKFRRGYRRDRNDWQNREQVREDDLDAANAHAIRALVSGAEEISVLCYPIGVPIRSQSDMDRFLAGIYAEMVSIHWMGGPFSPQLYAMFRNVAESRGLPAQQLSGSVDLDPILDSACGWTEAPMEAWAETTVPLVRTILEETPLMATLTIRGSLIEKSGASVAQELAFTMALLTEYLTGLRAAGIDPNAVAPRMELRHAVGSHYFLEIAKLRAHRILLSNVLEAFEVDSGRPHIHVDTTSSNKTLFDPTNNLLRATTEAMATAMAGVDSMSIAAFDQGYGSPDEFSEHLARNTDTLLKEEAFLDRVVDPLGGSYYVEALTDSLAQAAWQLLQKIEEQGGFIAAWRNGFIPAELDRVREEKTRRINLRRTPMVGTSVYPNLKERRLGQAKRFPAAHVLKSPGTDLAMLRTELSAGKRLQDWQTDVKVPSSPLNPFRPSWPLEHLRLRTERHVADGGKLPLAYLAKVGDPARAKARAGFCLSFLGAGGYDVFEPIATQTLADAIQDAQSRGADFLVLCSSDEEYGAMAADAVASGMKVLVAGAPTDMDALRAAGVKEFLHLKSDIVQTLGRLHEILGISEETV